MFHRVQYGFQWPPRMKCDGFPKFGKAELCMDEKKGELPPLTPNTIENPITPKGSNPVKTKVVPTFTGSTPKFKEEKCECECKAPLIKIDDKNIYFNRTIETGKVANCALPCHGGYGSEDEINFSPWWLSLWSGLCCFTTFVTLLTFLIDPNRLVSLSLSFPISSPL